MENKLEQNKQPEAQTHQNPSEQHYNNGYQIRKKNHQQTAIKTWKLDNQQKWTIKERKRYNNPKRNRYFKEARHKKLIFYRLPSWSATWFQPIQPTKPLSSVASLSSPQLSLSKPRDVRESRPTLLPPPGIRFHQENTSIAFLYFFFFFWSSQNSEPQPYSSTLYPKLRFPRTTAANPLERKIERRGLAVETKTDTVEVKKARSYRVDSRQPYPIYSKIF